VSTRAVILPAKDCAATLPAVLEGIARWSAGRGEPLHVVVVDDGTRVPLVVPERAGECPVQVVRHDVNRGYGGAQKSGYAAALAAGATQVAMLHGDGQYDTDDTLALLDALPEGDVPAGALGSRFLADPAVIPGWRRRGNRVLTGLANARYGVRHTELHTGARAFTAAALRALPLATYSDDYVFDQQVIVACFRQGIPLAEGPVRVRYDGTVQSIPPGRAVRYALGCVRVIAFGP
jgi:glycosyltransferase involved in cell wall biosynthesis